MASNKTDSIKRNDKIVAAKMKKGKENMLLALENALGIITTACKKCKINRDTHYRWYKTDEVYKEAVDSLLEVSIDFAETSLYAQIKDKVPSSTIFFLKTKGKKRGYQEHTSVVSPTKMSPPQIRFTRKGDKD